MPTSTIRFTPEFIKGCENIWRDGFTKSSQGVQELPDFKSFFSQSNVKEEPTYAELENLPFNSCKCEARVEKHGYAIQCTRSPFEGRTLCLTHQKMFDKLPEGKDIPYGRFNQPRPDVTLDKGNPISWGPKKSRKKAQQDGVKQPKLKVGEMRDFLSSRIPNTVFKDMKKRELTELYLKEKALQDSETSQEETPVDTPQEETSVMDSIEPTQEEKPVEPTQEEKPVELTQEEKPVMDSLEPAQEEKPVELTQEEKPVMDSLELTQEVTSEEKSQEKPDDGMGVGLKLEIKNPKTIAEYKTLFKELNIDTDGLKGKREYKQAYEDYLKSKSEEDEEKTQPMSDEEDDELQEDSNTYDETTFEGVSYLEDEENGKIYNLKHQHVGKWNEDVDDIIWISEEFKKAHESASQ